MIFYWHQCKWQTHFALLQEMSLLSLASFCQSRAVVHPVPYDANNQDFHSVYQNKIITWSNYQFGLDTLLVLQIPSYKTKITLGDFHSVYQNKIITWSNYLLLQVFVQSRAGHILFFMGSFINFQSAILALNLSPLHTLWVFSVFWVQNTCSTQVCQNPGPTFVFNTYKYYNTIVVPPARHLCVT